jgi:hypothetical protein
MISDKFSPMYTTKMDEIRGDNSSQEKRWA